MPRTVSLGRLFEIRIDIHVSWVVLYAFVTWSLSTQIAGVPRIEALAAGGVCALLLFASVIVHEFGHALCARICGVRTQSITLFLFGGVAMLEREPATPRAEAAIALAGPLTSLVVAGTAYLTALALGALHAGDVAVMLATFVAFANLVLAAFNLIPAFPMDGGRVLRAVLWQMRSSFARATAASAIVAIGFAVVLGAAGTVMSLSTHGWEYARFVALAAFLGRSGWLSYVRARSLVRLEAPARNAGAAAASFAGLDRILAERAA